MCAEFIKDQPMGHCRAKSPSSTKIAVPKPPLTPNDRPFYWDGCSYWPLITRTDWCVHDFIPREGGQQ